MKKFFGSQAFMFIFAAFAVIAVCGMDWGFRVRGRYRASSVQLKPFQPIRNAIKIRASRGGPVARAMVNQGATMMGRRVNRYSFMTDNVYETKVQTYSAPDPIPEPWINQPGTCPCGDSCPGEGCPCGCGGCPECADFSFMSRDPPKTEQKLRPFSKSGPKWFLGRGEGSTYSFKDMMNHCAGHTDMSKYHITEIGQLWYIHDRIHDGKSVEIYEAVEKPVTSKVTFTEVTLGPSEPKVVRSNRTPVRNIIKAFCPT